MRRSWDEFYPRCIRTVSVVFTVVVVVVVLVGVGAVIVVGLAVDVVVAQDFTVALLTQCKQMKLIAQVQRLSHTHDRALASDN